MIDTEQLKPGHYPVKQKPPTTTPTRMCGMKTREGIQIRTSGENKNCP